MTHMARNSAIDPKFYLLLSASILGFYFTDGESFNTEATRESFQRQGIKGYIAVFTLGVFQTIRAFGIEHVCVKFEDGASG